MKYYLVGYSGHAYVVIESAKRAGWIAAGYLEPALKEFNPYSLSHLGTEEAVLSNPGELPFFVGIGDNNIRANIIRRFLQNAEMINVIDPGAVVSETCNFGKGVYIGGGAIINALSGIGTGVIINTGAIVEHECRVKDFVHIAPGAVLCGNVEVGIGSFVGANAVVRQGVKIGDNVVVGAGAVVLNDIPDNTTVYGNPVKKCL